MMSHDRDPREPFHVPLWPFVAVAVLIILAAMLAGCAGMSERSAAELAAQRAEPCEVAIIEDGLHGRCVSREHLRQLLKDGGYL